MYCITPVTQIFVAVYSAIYNEKFGPYCKCFEGFQVVGLLMSFALA